MSQVVSAFIVGPVLASAQAAATIANETSSNERAKRIRRAIRASTIRLGGALGTPPT